jgi:hypothetical protein
VPKKHDKKNLTRFKRLRTRLSQIILFKNWLYLILLNQRFIMGGAH